MLFKPPGLLIAPDSRIPGVPSLTEEWQKGWKEEKPEFLATGWEKMKSIYWLDPEAHGLALLAEPGESLESLRNDYGSGKFRFRFELFVKETEGLEEEFEVDLPIKVSAESGVQITHRYGKKCFTHFKRIQRWRKVELWEATTDYIRPFQIRIHAWESMLKIYGESRLGRVTELFLSDLKRNYTFKEEERPLWPGLGMRLAEVSWGDERIVCPPVGPWNATLKQLQRYG